MPARSDSRSHSLCAVPRQVRRVAKDRLIIGGVLIAILPLTLSTVPWVHKAFDEWFDLLPWAHLTLEASLNLLWVLLSVIAVLRWSSPSGRRNRRRLAALVPLSFVLALLFPVISANDDLAQQALINDAMSAKSLSATFKADKQLHNCGEVSPPRRSASPRPVYGPAECIPQAALNQSVATPGEATGNHSPPIC